MIRFWEKETREARIFKVEGFVLFTLGCLPAQACEMGSATTRGLPPPRFCSEWHRGWSRSCTSAALCLSGEVGSDHVNAAELCCCPGRLSNDLNARLSSEKHPNMQMFYMNMILELWTSQRHRTGLENFLVTQHFTRTCERRSILKSKTMAKNPNQCFSNLRGKKIYFPILVQGFG